MSGIETEFAVLPQEPLAQDPLPRVTGLRRGHLVAAHPGKPFGDLRLVAPRQVADGLEGCFHVDGQIVGVFTALIPIVGIEDDRHLDRDRLRLVGGVFGREGVWDVDHVSHLAHRRRHRDMVYMNPRAWITGDGRAEQIVRLKVADGFPQGREQLGRDPQARLARDLSIGQAQGLKLESAEGGRGGLLA